MHAKQLLNVVGRFACMQASSEHRCARGTEEACKPCRMRQSNPLHYPEPSPTYPARISTLCHNLGAIDMHGSGACCTQHALNPETQEAHMCTRGARVVCACLMISDSLSDITCHGRQFEHHVWQHGALMHGALMLCTSVHNHACCSRWLQWLQPKQTNYLHCTHATKY